MPFTKNIKCAVQAGTVHINNNKEANIQEAQKNLSVLGF